MRVYEFAKQLNLSNKELMALLTKHGFEAKSHMVALPNDVVKAITDYIEQQKKVVQPKLEPKIEVKKDDIRAESPKKEAVSQQITEKSTSALRSPIIEKIETAPLIKIFLVEPMTVGQLSGRLEKPVSEIILDLLKQGIVCAKNQMLPENIVAQLARSYQFELKYPEAPTKKEISRVAVATTGGYVRLPVVVVIGHVDHGKTTLLDFIRKTKIAAKEKGGITQHLGAYEAQTGQGNLVFIDTPGHEAFSNIRGRGISVADIAILVVAADDSVMPQTIESIRKIKEAKIPVIVAINKVDKVEQRQIEAVKRDLARYDLITEEWGGQTICMPISAKTGAGIDQLLEMIVLQAQLMDLRADLSRAATGFVLESRLEKGRGSVATVICQNGTLRIGDFFSVGHMVGKVSSLIDSYENRLKEVGPSVPVQVAGFPELPKAGDFFEVITPEKFRELKSIKNPQFITDLTKRFAAEDSINIIIKTDTTSSLEALLNSLQAISEKGEKKLQIILSGIGDISESDVTLATDTGSQILGLHVKIEPNASNVAQKNFITIRTHEIIYRLLEEMEQATKEEEKPRLITKKIGEALVRRIFDIKDVGIIAGCYCREGRFIRDAKIIVWRGKKKVGEGKIKGLERDRKSVKEVHAGFEFAFLAEGFDAWELDDRIECFTEVPA